MSLPRIGDLLMRPLFGPDLFISYSRRNTRYAQKLVTLLRARNKRLSICVDQWAARPYPTTHPDLLALARRSSVFVLLASDDAVASPNVAEEIHVFRETGRKMVPVDMDGALARASWPGETSTMLASLGPEQETAGALADAEPSENVVSRILGSIDFHIQTQRIRFFAVAALIAGAAIVGGAELLRRHQERIALGLRLANESVAVLQQEPHRVERAVRLATESMDRLERSGYPLLAADLALRSALSILPRVERRAELGERGNVVVSRDGRFVAAADATSVLLCETARASCGLLPLAREPKHEVQNVAFSADGEAVAAVLTGGGSGALYVWRTATRVPIGRAIPILGDSFAVAVGRGGRVVAGGVGDRVVVYDAGSGTRLAESVHVPQPLTIEWSPDAAERYVLTTSDTAQVWEWKSGAAPVVLRREGVMRGRFAPNGDSIALLDAKGVSEWSWRNDREKPQWEGDLRPPLEDLRYSADGTFLAVSHLHDGVRVYDSATHKVVADLRGASAVMAFSTDGRTIVVAEGNRSVRLWDIEDERELARASHEQALADVAIRADGAVVSAAPADTMQVWRAGAWLEREIRFPETAKIDGMAFDPRTGDLAVAAPAVYRYDVRRETVTRTRVRGGGPLAFTTEGDLVTRAPRAWIRWRDWTSEAPQEREPLPLPVLRAARTLSIGANGAIAGDPKEVTVYDVQWRAQRRFAMKRGRGAALDRAGSYLATADAPGVTVYETRTGSVRQSLPTGAFARAVAFAPNGRVLATTNGPAIRLWERWHGREAREMARLQLQQWNAMHLAFSADGMWLAAASERMNQRVFLTKWRPADLIAAACEAVREGWTDVEWRSDLPGVAFEPVCARRRPEP
jgi:DNA-binding beta-propeller fold protein YncE